ncbi:MAG TPA: rod shape-determining protein MreD [Bryobacteraceae bacterium]|nr:rod shape-determining protein MreD [Bryobacteraceae bacterium]
MSDLSSDRLLADVPRRARGFRLRPLLIVFVPLAGILFQVYMPRFFHYLGYIEVPLLTVVYFSLMQRQPVVGVLVGAVVGLAQDSLSQQPLGIFGIVKTLVGYFAASVSMRFDVDNPVIQFVLSFFFFVFHEFFKWVLIRALLGQHLDFLIQQTLLFGLVNAVVAVPLFLILDKIKE